MRYLLLVLSIGLSFGVKPARAQRPADEPARLAADYPRLRAAIALQPDSGRIDQLREFSDRMIESGRFDQAQAALTDALATARATGKPSMVSRAETSLGYLAASQEQLPAALEHYQRAYDLIRHSTAYVRQARLLLRLGQIFTLSKDWPQAERYLRQSLAVAERHQLAAQVAATYGELSNLAGLRGQHDQAAAYNDRALALHSAAADWQGYYGTLVNQAITYKNLGRYAESAAAFRQILQFADSTDAYLRNYVYINFPNTLLQLNQPAEAERYALLGVAGLAAAPDQAATGKELYDALTRIKEAQHDYRQALTYQRLSTAYADTLLNAGKARQLIEIETRYQTKEKQARIARLAENNARQTRQLGALGAGVAALLLLLIVTIRQYGVIRHTNAQLSVTNQQVLDNNYRIREQADRLTMLMKELHHRVKNNLAIVSSLLRLQSNRLADAGAAKAVREGQQRVEAMAFIHQRLYQTDDVTTVDMRRYVADLAESLLTAYGHDPDDFELQLEVTQTTLDVDLAVPLGLILNELLTNALKYAYAEVARPLLRVYLGADPADPAALLLEVCDNGPGIAPERWSAAGKSFGHRLVTSLSEQVGGHLEQHNDHGACYRLRLPSPALLAAR